MEKIYDCNADVTDYIMKHNLKV